MSSFMTEPLQLQIPNISGAKGAKAKANTKKASASAKKATPIVKTSYTEIVLVDKTGTLKSLQIKEFKEEELYKKCGFKSADGFEKQTEWDIKLEGNKFLVSVYGKTNGKANGENKYDFPPPIDNVLFFGSCAIVAFVDDNVTDLSVEGWLPIYEKLFGGFEDLAATALEDEQEEDELANVPKEFLTKEGYLKDGFVVDSDESDCDEELSEESYLSEDE